VSSRFKPSHRLNLLLVPEDPERELDEAALAQALDSLNASGRLDGDRPGPAADELVRGGFKLIRVDRPLEATLYGNRQGGFYVRCPSCGDNVAHLVGPALRRWRAGQGRGLGCSGCEAGLDLARLDYAPPAAAGRFALELRDVGSPELNPLPELSQALGGDFIVVGSRG
jgi:hypothetical protein